MTDARESARGLRAERLADVDRAVNQVAETVVGGHPYAADQIRAALAALRSRLVHVHGACQEVAADTWSTYVAELDSGLDQLHIELARTADRPDSTATVEELLFTRCTQLELDGWRLRFDVQRLQTTIGPAAAQAELADLTTEAAQALAQYEQTADGGAGGATRSEVEKAMDRIRGAVPSAPTA